jgi:hypothetical protein
MVSGPGAVFRAQASRAVGGNGRRTSHNPPDPALLDIYDRIGVTVRTKFSIVYRSILNLVYSTIYIEYRV